MDYDGPFAITNFLKTVKPVTPDSPNIQPDFILGTKSISTQAPSSNILESLFSLSHQQSDRDLNSSTMKSGVNMTQQRYNNTNPPKRHPIEQFGLNSLPITKTKELPNRNVHKEEIIQGPLSKEAPATIIQGSTEQTIQTTLESILLPAVSSACVQYMNQLTNIFTARLERIMKQHSCSVFDGDEPLIQLLAALQNQDFDQVINVLNGLDSVGNLFSCLSIPRLFDLVSLLTRFISEYSQNESTTSTYLSLKDSDAVSLSLPWILEALIAIRYLTQRQPILFPCPITPSQHPHSCYILRCLKDQLEIIQMNFSESLDSENGNKIRSIIHILDNIWADTE